MAALVAVALLAGCAASTEEEAGGDVAALSAAETKTVCFGGRTAPFGDPYSIGGISELDALCKQMPNVVRDGPGGTDADYHFFQWNSDMAHVLDRIVDALDTNNDGVVTNLDARVDLTLVGYSWGGFNARDVAERIGTDWRFSPSRRSVARLFTLDAFRTDYLYPRSEIRVPANVGTFYSFRHSVGPDDDCSSFLYGLIGPFTGRDPSCTGTTVCHDYDYSKAASTAGIDHCEVPEAATPAILDITYGRTPTLPRDQPVRRY